VVDVQTHPRTEADLVAPRTCVVDGELTPLLVVEAPAALSVSTEGQFGRRGILNSAVERWGRVLQTPWALRAGTGVTVVLAIAALSSLIIVGIRGVGTYPAALPVASGVGTGTTSSYEPSAIFGPTGPQPFEQPRFIPGANIDAVVSKSLSLLVLQPSDLPVELQPLTKSPTGGDPSSELLTSYNALFQRKDLPATVNVDQTIAITSIAGIYKDVQAASTQLNGFDPVRLAAESGLAGLDAQPAAAPGIGDESRAFRLAGRSAGIDIGYYLIQFRRDNLLATVGVAAVRGSESYDRAVDLARVQDGRIQALLSSAP